MFEPGGLRTGVPGGSLIYEAAREAGVDLNVPCGAQGRCGRCAVIVEDGDVRRRSTLRLSEADVARGYALACQTVIESDVVVRVPPQEKIERRLTTDKTVDEVVLPPDYEPSQQPLRAFYLEIEPPSLADQTDDWSRVQRALRQQHAVEHVTIDLPTLQRLGPLLREADWQVTAIVETVAGERGPGRAALGRAGTSRLVDVVAGDRTDRLYGIAVDIGTTSNVVYLVDLLSGRVVVQRADYNAQIARGEDIISRIIYASKNDGLGELQSLVLGTLNGLIERVAKRARIETREIYKATVAGNTTMIHLFLGIPPQSIRLQPFVPAANQPPTVLAREVGGPSTAVGARPSDKPLAPGPLQHAPEAGGRTERAVSGLGINPAATVDCLPGVASYVGADITAGVVSSGLTNTEALTLFMDIGTNGETVLGTRDWLITCACSAGPAFEGAGVEHGMRATLGAIEEVWINSQTYEPTYRVIGERRPKGICGSGLISLLAELFITGIMDKSGNMQLDTPTPRVREGEHGAEYVVAWADETEGGSGTSLDDIVITKVDVDNLLRAKAAIYAGYTSLCASVGVDPADVEQVLIGGAFGQYINIEKAIQIGLLPDMPWDRFKFLGNTSVRGAYLALLSEELRQQVADAAAKMTYLELSADNSFYSEFTSALFLPHTDIAQFPSVESLLDNGRVVAEPVTSNA